MCGCVLGCIAAPNCDWHITEEGRFEVRAAAAIAAGESCTISFEGANLHHDQRVRKAALLENHGFDCLCTRCCRAGGVAAVTSAAPDTVAINEAASRAMTATTPSVAFMKLAEAAAPDLFTLLPEGFLRYLQRVGAQHAALHPAVPSHSYHRGIFWLKVASSLQTYPICTTDTATTSTTTVLTAFACKLALDLVAKARDILLTTRVPGQNPRETARMVEEQHATVTQMLRILISSAST